MQITKIDGANMVLAENQDEYQSLPVRVTVEDSLVCYESAWIPDEDELRKLNNGGKIVLSVLTTQHPPVMLGVEE